MERRLTKTIFEILNRLNIPTILLGGLALPAYNVLRTTIDIDICIYVKSQIELDNFIIELNKKNIQTQQTPKIDHDLFIVFGASNEAEIWLRPCDSFNWDDQMVAKIQNFLGEFHVLSIEDFLLTKLARSDRSAIDLDDILQLLINNISKIDWDYFRYRINWLDMESDFKDILEAFQVDLDDDKKEIALKLLNKFEKFF